MCCFLLRSPPFPEWKKGDLWGGKKKVSVNTGVVPGADVGILLFALRDHLHPEGA